MRIGIDLGGTKIEALALADDGRELARHRIATPRGDYAGTLAAIAGLVARLETETGQRGSVGAGIPGSLRHADAVPGSAESFGVVKNANSTWLNGRPLLYDLTQILGREVRLANDANCLAVSEATDGAAAGAAVVFAVILGTGCGGGIAFGGRVHAGPNGVAGEWGHNPLPWASAAELPGPRCYCGRSGCLEQWVSGPAVSRDHAEATGQQMTTREIAALAESGDPAANATLDRLLSRLGRGLAMIVNALDPDVIVFGGGVSRIARLYEELAAHIQPCIFGGDFTTPLRPAAYGDSSGVRGAAWLWPAAAAHG